MIKASRLACSICLLLVSPLVTGQTYSRIETIEYHDDTTLWVLGQIKTSTNVDTGLVESRTDYDPATALPIRTYAFGKLQQTLTYDTTSAVSTGQRGTVKTVSDARDTPDYDTTITLGNWKRGIPQFISYPDGTSQSAVVDDLGRITSVTNEAGARTCYQYDAMGRLSRMTYPSESQAGACADYNASTNPNGSLPTLQTFAPAAVSEYGIPAGHWKQTVTTGNGTKVTYFDAFWRPLVVETYDAADAANTRSLVVTRYDADGRTVFQSYPMRTFTNYAAVDEGTYTTYDALGRPTEILQDSELGPLQTTIAYLSGFKRKTTRPNGQATGPNVGTATVESFQTFDVPSYDAPVQIDAPENTRTLIERDVFGKPLSITRGSSL